ncbi:MAG: ABC transporter ATP-binding protein [Ignavibacteriae bacterium]|nr:ABC transporter ATP-binding protein [Ignavibacteriota bacterium]
MIRIEGLHKSFSEGKTVLRGVNLDIQTGETLAIIGQSGCGKSVLLKHIIGLLRPDSGSVQVDGAEVHTLPDRELYALRARFGFLFQGAALFDSMTVAENVALGLVENTDMAESDIRRIVAEKLEMVGLPGIERLKPAELSGGMKKRVGLARALATNPDYLLYDEPTTGLDPVMSNQIDALIADLTARLNVTSIVVTHDMFSVYTIAHRVALLHEGRTYFQGTPDELRASQDVVVRDFLERYRV